MAEVASLEFRLIKIDETRNYLLDEISHNDWISEKYTKIGKYLNYAENLFIPSCTITACASLVCVPVVIINSAVGMSISTTTAGIKKYKSIIMKKKKKHDLVVF